MNEARPLNPHDRFRSCRRGLVRPVVWFLVFATWFFAFEVFHPLADLLHEHTHCAAAADGVPAPGSQSGEDLARDAHGPFVPALVAPAVQPCGSTTLAWTAAALPESPVLEPRSPVPISS